MSRQIQIRRGTVAQHETFTGAVGELTFDGQTLRVHDGTTVGGIILARADEIPDTPTVSTHGAMPDYENATNIPATGTYVAETDLYIQGYAKLVWGARATIQILNASDTVVMTYYFQANDINATRYMSFSIPVPAGYKYSVAYGGNSMLVGSIVPCMEN